MFESIGQIEWRKLKHAYGAASDVPACLRNLVSDSKDERLDAYCELTGNIWHQGTVYEATAFAVPFLIEIVRNETAPEREQVVGLLDCIARGSSYHEVHQRFSPISRRLLAPLWRRKIRRELGWVAKAREAVRACIPLYMELLSHQKPAIRERSASLLASFRGENGVARAIAARLDVENDPKVISALLAAQKETLVKETP